MPQGRSLTAPLRHFYADPQGSQVADLGNGKVRGCVGNDINKGVDNSAFFQKISHPLSCIYAIHYRYENGVIIHKRRDLAADIL